MSMIIKYQDYFFQAIIHLTVNHNNRAAPVMPAMWEIWVRRLGWEDPLEEDMATHSSTLARKIPGTGEHGGLPSMGSHRVRHD